MPLKAWIRAVELALAGVIPLIACVAGANRTAGGARVAFTLGAVAIAAVAGYLMWLYLPDVDLPGRSPRRGRRAPKGEAPRIAITFDDGPNGEHTEHILDVLKRHGARATFFCVGDAAVRYPELVRRMVSDGHVVGNHTLDHRKLAWCTRDEVARQLAGAQDALAAAGVPRPSLFRAPHGFKSPHLPRVLREQSLRMVAWSHGVWDTDRPGADVIARRALRHLGDGEILLLHDGLPGCDRFQTAEALDVILTECARRGLRTVTLPEML